jgi:hypothetical protein
MGMVKIQLEGSFPRAQFSTCAEEGGHVMALKRGIEFLTSKLGEAVVKDAELTKLGIDPPSTPLGTEVRVR